MLSDYNKYMKIGILGGSFDPPHLGHMGIARQLLINKLVDQVWLLPCFSHAFEKKMSKVADRFAMAKLLVSDGIEVSDYEINKEAVSYTIDTMDFLTKDKTNDFFWIMGSDQLFVIEKYKDWKKLIENHNLIIYPRQKDFYKICNFVDELIKKVTTSQNLIVLDPKEFKTIEISSTDIREKVKKGESISRLVPEKIEKYIQDNKLYI
jgi:nicotinate-nucleotide adenylyltransferase